LEDIPVAERNPHDVVRLATASTPVEAHLMEQALRAEGIECKVVGDYLDAGFGDVPGVQPEVWVHKADLAAATAVLEQSQSGAAPPEASEPEA
jgi:hypothetical protein